MSNKFKALALLPIFSIVFTACTLADLPLVGRFFGETPVVTGPVTLNVWGLWEEPEVISFLIEQFRSTNASVTINYEDRSVMDLPSYKERVYTRIREESSDVDVMLVHNSWLPELIPNLAPAPNNIIDENTFADRYYPVAYQDGVSDGRVYAIPAYYDGLVMVYNRSHFSEVGQSLPPTAWEEFRRLAVDLTVYDESNNLVRGGAAMGTANNITHFSDILGLMWVQAGLDIPQETNSTFAADALTYYVNFSRQDRVWNNSMPEASTAFVNEQVSMIFVPSWQILDILRFMPNVNDVGVAPVPQVNPQSPVTWASYWMYVVPQNGAHSSTAWDYIHFLGQEEQQLSYFNEASKLRFFGPMYTSPSLSGQINNPYLQVLGATAPFAKSGTVAGRAGNRRQVDGLSEAVNAVLNGRSAQEALSAVYGAIN